MVTLPPEPSPFSARESHQARKIAESFGSDPGRYDRTRPSYPRALVDRVMTASPGRDVLDVGVGTGISARAFQAAGCRVLGVEADPRMAAYARQRGLEVEVSRFEDWDPAGRSVDAVIAGQAWHWVDPVAGAARAAGVLRPGGVLVPFWNAFEPPARLWDAFAEVYRRALPELPFRRGVAWGAEAYAGQLAKAAEGIAQAGGFGEPERWQFGWTRSYTRDEWLDQVPTAGGFSHLAPQTQADLLAGVGAALDAAGGRFTMGYTTVAVAAARTGAARS
jgi:SAM-dependent methyltransferase